ncbi:DinB family protein [Rubrivirga sp. IMCC45206]|uniref:DinB family protein n=1 Tax=Rubrivirga sp. IMCC45206 TaxID=3391614 RepID=UPI00398FCBBF
MSDPTPASDDADLLPTSGEWYAAAARLPRRDQSVRVRTGTGHFPLARFEVAFTEDWPAGVSWVLGSDQRLPFSDVVAWTPDVEAPAPEPDPPPVAEPVPEPDTPRPLPALAAELQSEVERTKAVLRLLPQSLMDWSPHPDIPTLSTLALRTVRIAARIGWMLDLDEMEQSFEPDVPDFETVDQIFVSYSANAEEVAELIEALDGERLSQPWRLVRNGGLVSEMPRGNALRWYGLTPLIHHRAEISIMLRALGIHPPHLYPGWAFTDAVAGERWEVPPGAIAPDASAGGSA